MALLTVDICLGVGSDGRLDGCLIMFPSLITSWISRECVMNVQINIYDIYVISLFRVKREPRSAWCKHLRSTAIYSNPQTHRTVGHPKIIAEDHLNMKRRPKTHQHLSIWFSTTETPPHQDLTGTLPGPYHSCPSFSLPTAGAAKKQATLPLVNVVAATRRLDVTRLSQSSSWFGDSMVI